MRIKIKDKRFKKFQKKTRHNWRYILDWRKSRFFKWLVTPLLIVGLLSAAIIIVSYVAFPPIKNYNFGTSFSIKKANDLGVNWQDNFTALLDDLKIREYRLMSYWDVHEPERGKLDFSQLDWQMDEAAKRGAKVSLAIGERQPRWPECHHPAWAKKLSGHEWKQALYGYMETVIKRYENHPALESWQLENEYFNAGFGECSPPDRQRFEEEFALVKSLSKKPLWASLADQHGLPLSGPTPDSFGYSIYRLVYNNKFIPGYIWYPTPMWYHHFRTAIIKFLHPNTHLFIHELQLEPWGPTDYQHISIAEQDRTMSYDQIHSNVTFARRVGFEDIYAWGAEWWYWRKTVHHDVSVWEAVRREIETSRSN